MCQCVCESACLCSNTLLRELMPVCACLSAGHPSDLRRECEAKNYDNKQLEIKKKKNELKTKPYEPKQSKTIFSLQWTGTCNVLNISH